MPIERLDRSRIVGLSEADVDAFIESDFKIRSGLCPNGHGLMALDGWGQECAQCGFTTNKMPDKDTSQ